MKKLIFLPVVLAVFGFAMIPSNPLIKANASEGTSLTLNLSDMAKAVDSGANTSDPVVDVDTDLVTYGFRGGNPETATYTTFVQNTQNWWDYGNIETDNCFIDWGALRIVVNSDYIIAFMRAKQDLTLTISGTPAEDNLINNIFKYYVTEQSFDFSTPTPLVADYSATSTDTEFVLSGTYKVYEGETFMFAYGKGAGVETCALQNTAGVTFTLTAGITPSSETNNIQEMYCVPSWLEGDKTTDLAKYGVRFGQRTETNPYSIEYTRTKDDKYTVNGNVVEWWHIVLSQDLGFAFSVTASKRVMVTPTFANVTSVDAYYRLKDTTINYDIYRNGAHLKQVYSYQNTNNLSVDIPNYNSVGAIELLPGDVLYVGFTLNEGADPDTGTLELKDFNNFIVSTTEVLARKAVTNFVNDWFALRNSNNLDLCDLGAEDQAKLDSLIERYNSLTADDRTIVDRTIDVKGYTIAESISYFSTLSSGFNNKLNTIINNGSNAYMILIVLGCVGILLVSLLVYKKRTNK